MNILTLGLHKSPVRKTDWLLTSFVSDLVDKDLPAVDLTEEQSPVKMQARKGACAGFGGVGWVEWITLKDYDMTPAEYDDTVDFSEQMLYELARRQSGHREGTTLDAIRYILTTEGVCREKLCPYTDDKSALFEYTEEMKKDASNFKIEKNYVRVANEKELHSALYRYGAFHIGVKVYKNWYRQENGHIPTATWTERINLLGGHAILLVGYNPVTKEYKFKNSWDTSWGDKGYGYLTKKEMQSALMDGIVMFDLDDPNQRPPELFISEIKTVADMSFVENIEAKGLKLWV